MSKFVECWTFRRAARKKPKSEAFGVVWTRRICRTVSKVGFFDECRKKSQKKRYFWYIFIGFFRAYADFVQFQDKIDRFHGRGGHRNEEKLDFFARMPEKANFSPYFAIKKRKEISRSDISTILDQIRQPILPLPGDGAGKFGFFNRRMYYVI